MFESNTDTVASKAAVGITNCEATTTSSNQNIKAHYSFETPLIHSIAN
jgi:hypothetical protein